MFKKTLTRTNLNEHQFPAQKTGQHGCKIRVLKKEELTVLEPLNRELFGEKRIINRTNHDFLLILGAFTKDIPVGFKVGYGLKENVFYSAKGGVLQSYRGLGIATDLLETMMQISKEKGYESFKYDTFPNMHPGMLRIGLKKNFNVIFAGWNAQYNDYQITLSKTL